MAQPSLKRKMQALVLFLAMPLSLLATIPLSQYTVHSLRDSALQQQEILIAQYENNDENEQLTHKLVKVLILPFAMRRSTD